MNISNITSQLAQESGYTEQELTTLLGNDRMEYFNNLAAQAERMGAAQELGLEYTEGEEEIYLPPVGCSLGDINIGEKLRELADRDPEKYKEIANALSSGNEETFIVALKELTQETETTLRGEISQLDQGKMAQFIINLEQLTRVEDDSLLGNATNADAKTDPEADPAADPKDATSNFCTVMGTLTGIDEKALAKTIKGIQIYV